MFMAAKISIIFQSSKLFRVNYANLRLSFNRCVIRPVFGQDHSSHICAVYPRFFVDLATIRTFASSNDKKKMETERILLRPWQDSDAEALFKYASDPDVGPSARWQPHKSVEDSLEIFRTVFNAEEMWAVIWKESGECRPSA